MRFPNELPIDDMKVVFDFVRGNPNNIPKNVVVESAWWTVGYGAGVTFGNPTIGFVPKSVSEAHKELESILEPHVTFSGNEAKPPIDWMKVIQLILTILSPLFASGN